MIQNIEIMKLLKDNFIIKFIMTQQKKVVIISGYFCPAHEGHIEYAKEAKELAGSDGIVYCIVNSDYQAELKKGFSFMPENDRLVVMGALKYVDKAYLSIDTDRTVCETIRMLYDMSEYKPTHFFN